MTGIPVALQLSVKLGQHGLPLRSAVIARRRRRLRVVAALAVVSVVGFVAAVTHEIWPQRAEVVADVAKVFTSPTPADASLAALHVDERPVYRHSIVPGGAYSRSEVADAIRKDEVVAAHYADIDVEHVHPTTVTAARAVYVSYRVGDRVFWTKNRVRLSPGEKLLTDGTSEIRARCGNLVSDHAQQPVAAEEPPVATLDETQPETGSSTIAGARDDDGLLHDRPDLPTIARSLALGQVAPLPGVPATPMRAGGGEGGATPFAGPGTGTGGTSLVTPFGNSGRPNQGNNNGGGPNGGGSNGGGSNGGGSNGGGSNGGGSNGGGDTDPHPPTDTPTTTTGDAVTTTTGSPGDDTTGFSDTTGGLNTTTTGGGETDTTGSGLTDTSGAQTDTSGDETTGRSVPEPATLTLLALGAIGAASRKLRNGRS